MMYSRCYSGWLKWSISWYLWLQCDEWWTPGGEEMQQTLKGGVKTNTHWHIMLKEMRGQLSFVMISHQTRCDTAGISWGCACCDTQFNTLINCSQIPLVYHCFKATLWIGHTSNWVDVYFAHTGKFLFLFFVFFKEDMFLWWDRDG